MRIDSKIKMRLPWVQHVFSVYLGETLVPFATLDPLKAVLPLKLGETRIPTDREGVSNIRQAMLGRRMRERWRTVSSLWEENKAAANNLNLLGQLDFFGKLSAQLEWKKDPGNRPIRVVYNQSGAPTAALLSDNDALVDYTLFWVVCKGIQEANYLLTIINSDTLATAVNKFTTANWAGNTRHLHKHLWKLPIPEFDDSDPLHLAISRAGEAAAAGAAKQLGQLRQDRPKLTVTIARRELRRWLRESAEGKAVEEGVGELLGAG